MAEWFRFFLFEEPNTALVAMGCVLIGLNAGMAGTFTYLRKNALVGDLVAHSLLPGVALAFIFTGAKNAGPLLAGAIVSGMLSMQSVEWLAAKTRLKRDTLMAVVLSIFFAIGLMLFTIIQQSQTGAQTGLDRFLFGKAASMSGIDVRTFSIIAVLNLVLILAFLNPFRLIAFDSGHGKALGMPTGLYRNLLTAITVISIATGIQAVGVVLMAALFIIPSVIGRLLTHRLELMLLIAAFSGAFAGLMGAWVSYLNGAMPTGPWIVVCLSLVAFGALFFAPKVGVVSTLSRRKINQYKISTENILKALSESDGKMPLEAISAKTGINRNTLFSILRKLKRSEMVHENAGGMISLSPAGLAEAERIIYLHFLWEIYLEKRLNLSIDIAHEGAEAMEHLLNPEIERQLRAELGSSFPLPKPEHHKP
jgi:manganese/zinc/iron transport system permease protein